MQNKAYWISVLVGLLVIIILYYNAPGRYEHFAAAAAPACTVDPTGQYSEDMSASVPDPAKVAVYLSSFSDYIGPVTAANGTMPAQAVGVYCQASQRWSNYKQGLAADGSADSFFILPTGTGATLPASIRQNGMPLNGIKLKGPPSNFFGDQLGGFSMAFYASFADLNAATAESPVVLWRMYAETTSTGVPIMVQLAVLPNPNVASEVNIRLTVGDVNADQRIWSVPKSTLVSTNMPVLYAITYDAANTRKAFFYAGSAVYKADPYYDSTTQIPPIKLTSTEVYINQNANMNGALYAFLWYNGFLDTTAINALNAYFTRQWTGTSRDLSNVAATAANAIRGLQVQTQAVAAAQSLLDTCLSDKEACVASLPKETGKLHDSILKKWQIALSGDLGSATLQDLAACSPLWVRSISGAPVGVSAPAAAVSAPVTPNISGLPGKYVISYPSAAAASSAPSAPAVAAPTATAPAATATTTTTPAATSASANTKTVQTTITTTTDSNTKDLNDTYKEILDALEKQKKGTTTAAENSPLENNTLQDSKKTDSVPKQSGWDKFISFFGF